MANWLESMQQSYEYYIVDPGTWKDKTPLKNVKSSSITRDESVQTLGSATIDTTEDIGECYVRIYLVTIQNGVTEKHPLGTFLAQTPTSSFDGKVKSTTIDAYTPLIELKENQPPIGYFTPKDKNIMETVYLLTKENLRAPVVKTEKDTKLYFDFVADTNDTWISYNSDLLANAKYKYALDEMGRVLFEPIQDTASLQPVCTFDDGNSSILYPRVDFDHDIYGIPNVVEVIHSTGSGVQYAKAINDDPNSPTSTVNRGREIVHRITNPDLIGSDPTKREIDEYAKRMLTELSTIECTVSFTHGYRPVRLGDCVRLNYVKAGLNGVKAKIISQTIKCEPGCSVQAKAKFTKKLWG